MVKINPNYYSTINHISVEPDQCMETQFLELPAEECNPIMQSCPPPRIVGPLWKYEPILEELAVKDSPAYDPEN